MEIEKIIKILRKECQKFSKPYVEIKQDPYPVLISCLLSLRTKDKTTAEASNKLFRLAKTPQQIIKLNLKQIEKAIYPVGFYRVKAKRIKEISKKLIEDYNGKVPDNIDELLKLKGVGRKTASIVMLHGYKKNNYIPVDIHVHVIANRLGWVKTKNPEQTEKELMKIIPKRYWKEINSLFVIYGQNICITISPWCSKCVIRKYCPRIGVIRNR